MKLIECPLSAFRGEGPVSASSEGLKAQRPDDITFKLPCTAEVGYPNSLELWINQNMIYTHLKVFVVYVLANVITPKRAIFPLFNPLRLSFHK